MNWYNKNSYYKRNVFAGTMLLNNRYTGDEPRTITFEIDPSLDQIIHLASLDRHTSVRFIQTPAGLYAWPSSQSVHAAVAEHLKVHASEFSYTQGDAAEVKVDGNKLFIWNPDNINLPWAQNLQPYTLDNSFQYQMDLGREALRRDPIDIEREQRQESFEQIDKPSSPYYKRWGD